MLSYELSFDETARKQAAKADLSYYYGFSDCWRLLLKEYNELDEAKRALLEQILKPVQAREALLVKRHGLRLQREKKDQKSCK